MVPGKQSDAFTHRLPARTHKGARESGESADVTSEVGACCALRALGVRSLEATRNATELLPWRRIRRFSHG